MNYKQHKLKKQIDEKTATIRQVLAMPLTVERQKNVHSLIADIRTLSAQMSDAPERLNPRLQEITELYQKKHGISPMSCPKCGAPDRGNTNNGKPYCASCRTELTREKHATKKLSNTEIEQELDNQLKMYYGKIGGHN